jgi:DNA (cytosine-5)-methyltransferase 1
VLPPEGFYRGNAPRSVDDPVQTITSRGGGHLVAPGFLVPSNYGERPGQVPRVHSIDSPVPTVVGSNTHGLARPGFIVKYNGTATVCDPADPLDTITAKDRFGVLTSEVADVLFRMLQPHELAAAMGFPASYIFTGTRGDRVKQIGNAVEVNKAKAHLVELLLAL